MKKQTVKIAYMVQCHKNAKQINMLTKRLCAEDCDVYIHLDRKSTAIRSQIEVNEKINLLPIEKSVSVEWGGFSQCLATLNLITAVMESGKEYDYIWLLSGQDYPLYSASEISEKLSLDKTSAFINIMVDEDVKRLAFDKRNDVYHVPFMIGQKTWQKCLKNLWYIVTGGKRQTFGACRRKRPVDQFYYGSQWWCLPYDCITEMVAYITKNSKYIRFFQHAICPDECFFQTLFMQTSFANNARGNLTYIDWSEGKNSPRTFRIRDWADIAKRRDRYVFARKFDIALDSEIIRRIDIELLNESASEPCDTET